MLNRLKENAILGKFCSLFGFEPGRRNTPPDVLDLLKKRKAYLIVSYIDWSLKQTNGVILFAEIVRLAKVYGWPVVECKKLTAYANYFKGELQLAYKTAEPYLDDESFDADFAGLALMCLYNANQFSRAYSLLKNIRTKEDLMLGNFGYRVAAAVICWSMGDRYLANKYTDFAMARRGSGDSDIDVYNAIPFYFEMGDMVAFERSLNILDESGKKHSQYSFCVGYTELAKNDYARGFEMLEARYGMLEAQRHMRKELLELPRWGKGEDISGKTLLIHGEQGLGDMIQTARFFSECVRLSKRVLVECPDESIALLEHNFPEITFVPLRVEASLVKEPFDLWIGTLSLPYIFGVNHESIPCRKGYLKIPADHVDYWRRRVTEKARSGAAKIGIAWSGHPGHRADRRRSLSFDLVKKMIECWPEIDFFAVQVKVPEDLPSNLHDCTDEMVTLSDTAALINEMDLIITVDTSVVHIAGAIGKQTWMMLPYRYEWRWGLSGDENSWYDSVKVLRQPAPGAWAPVLSCVFGRRLRGYVERRQQNVVV